MTIFFDNTFSRKAVEFLRGLRPHSNLVHLQDEFQSNIIDASYIPLIALRGYKLLTGDGRMRKNPVEREILKRAGIPTIFVFNGYTAQTANEQLGWLLNNWDAIEAEFAAMSAGEMRHIDRNGLIEGFQERSARLNPRQRRPAVDEESENKDE